MVKICVFVRICGSGLWALISLGLLNRGVVPRGPGTHNLQFIFNLYRY